MDNFNLLGKPVSESIKYKLKAEIDALQEKNIVPKLLNLKVWGDIDD